MAKATIGSIVMEFSVLDAAVEMKSFLKKEKIAFTEVGMTFTITNPTAEQEAKIDRKLFWMKGKGWLNTGFNVFKGGVNITSTLIQGVTAVGGKVVVVVGDGVIKAGVKTITTVAKTGTELGAKGIVGISNGAKEVNEFWSTNKDCQNAKVIVAETKDKAVNAVKGLFGKFISTNSTRITKK